MSYISVLFCRYANHVSVSRIVKANHKDECDLPSTIRMPSIFDKKILLVMNGEGRHVVMTLHLHIA
jgi:hypothetical protein